MSVFVLDQHKHPLMPCSEKRARLLLSRSCHDCNQAKGNRTASEFGYPEVEKQARIPLKDASAVNATRFALVACLGKLGLPIGTWSGGRTRWNRARWGIKKTHANDALCVGDMAGVEPGKDPTLSIKATGKGSHCRTNVDDSGFPRGYLTRRKRIRGFSTGDLVRAVARPISKRQECMWGGSRCERQAHFGWARSMGSMPSTVSSCNVRMVTPMDRFDWRGRPNPCPNKERRFPPHA